nr:STARP-like antigen [Hymenolepis microstoma]CUU98238.1 STARP-like antigen [Hymenolepis microstoma]
MDPSQRRSLFPDNADEQIEPIPTDNQNDRLLVQAFPIIYAMFNGNSQRNMLPTIEPSESGSSVQGTSTLVSEQERNRKDKKRYLERKRRSKINYLINTMHNLVFEMSGEKFRKTEICGMLTDCLTVIKSLYKNVMGDPILKARVLPPGLLSSEVTETNSCVEDTAVSPFREKEEGEGEEGEEVVNVPSGLNKAPFSPVSIHPSSNQTMLTLIEYSERKKDSIDSGLEQSRPSSSKGSGLTSTSQIWRPYLD